MENIVCRSRAKAVVIVDIVLICLVVMVVIFLTCYFGMDLFFVQSKTALSGDVNFKDAPSSLPSSFLWIIGIVTAVFVLVIGLQICAAVKLLKATTIGDDPGEWLEMSYFWRSINIICLIFPILVQMKQFNVFVLIFTVVWKGISLYVVRQFMMELIRFLSSPRSVEYNRPEYVVIA